MKPFAVFAQSSAQSSVQFPAQFPAQNGFDAFRWIAALIVVLSHYFVLSNATLPFVMPTAEAVQFFFILSGALTYRSFLANPDPTAFYKRRARRILPAYWGTIVLCLLVGLLFTQMPLRNFVSHPDTWRYVGWNVLMLNRFQPDLPATFADHELAAMDGALWTMKYEVAFYLLLPALVLLMRRTGKMRTLLSAYVLLTLFQFVLRLISWHFGGETAHLLASRGVSQAACFVAGMIVCEAYPALAARRRWLLPLALLICVSTAVFWPVRVVWPLAFGAAIILIGTATPRLGVFRRLPNITYELFLVHFPLIQATIAARLPERLGLWPAFATVLVLSLFFAYLLHRSVKPITDKK